jgi:hypothetical protein
MIVALVDFESVICKIRKLFIARTEGDCQWKLAKSTGLEVLALSNAAAYSMFYH